MMKNFKHPHVLELMGVCLAEGEFPMVILPFMKDGDLRTYVKDKSRVIIFKRILIFILFLSLFTVILCFIMIFRYRTSRLVSY